MKFNWSLLMRLMKFIALGFMQNHCFTERGDPGHFRGLLFYEYLMIDQSVSPQKADKKQKT